MTFKIKEPTVNYTSKAAIGFKNALIDPENGTWFITAGGAPTNGTAGDGAGWAGIGSLYIDVVNGYLYINASGGTKASPNWVKVGIQT